VAAIAEVAINSTNATKTALFLLGTVAAPFN